MLVLTEDVFVSDAVRCQASRVRHVREVVYLLKVAVAWLGMCFVATVASFVFLLAAGPAGAQVSGTQYVAGPLTPFNGYVNSTGQSVGLVVCATPRLSFEALVADPGGCVLASVLGGGAYGECPSGSAGCWYVIGAWPPVPVASEPPASGPVGREGEDVQLHIIAMGSAAVALFALGVIGGLQR